MITVTSDVGLLKDSIAKLTKEGRDAYSKAINDTAFYARKKMGDEFREKFDRVTPYIEKSPIVRMSTPDTLTATIEPEYKGGKGIDPKNVLNASIAGGERKLKRFERAFAAIGILQPGYYATIPNDPIADKIDGYGNYKGSFYTQLISYFGAFAEQGYRANMTDKKRAKLANAGVSNGYKTINGVVYFLSWGNLRTSDGGKTSPLPYGIWQKSGIHGSNVKPVLLFVKAPNYKKIIDIDKVGNDAVDSKFIANFETRMRAVGL